MDNHCHLVVETVDGNLSKRMSQFVYARPHRFYELYCFSLACSSYCAFSKESGAAESSLFKPD